jgi:hypothetical protein
MEAPELERKFGLPLVSTDDVQIALSKTAQDNTAAGRSVF